VEALRRVPGIGRRLATSIVAGLQRAKASQGALGTTPSTGRIPLSRPLPPVLRLQTDPRPPPPPPPYSPSPPRCWSHRSCGCPQTHAGRRPRRPRLPLRRAPSGSAG
jgi:hypothetical protein